MNYCINNNNSEAYNSNSISINCSNNSSSFFPYSSFLNPVISSSSVDSPLAYNLNNEENEEYNAYEYDDLDDFELIGDYESKANDEDEYLWEENWYEQTNYLSYFYKINNLSKNNNENYYCNNKVDLSSYDEEFIRKLYNELKEFKNAYEKDMLNKKKP